MMAPTWPGSWPGTSAEACFTRLAMRSGWSPTTNKADAAMHRWPAQPLKEAIMSRDAISTLRSGKET